MANGVCATTGSGRLQRAVDRASADPPATKLLSTERRETTRQAATRPSLALEFSGCMQVPERGSTVFDRFTSTAKEVVVEAQEQAKALATTTSAPSTSCWSL